MGISISISREGKRYTIGERHSWTKAHRMPGVVTRQEREEETVANPSPKVETDYHQDHATLHRVELAYEDGNGSYNRRHKFNINKNRVFSPSSGVEVHAGETEDSEAIVTHYATNEVPQLTRPLRVFIETDKKKVKVK